MQLQHLVSDPAYQVFELYQQEHRKGACGGPVRTAHLREVQENAYQRLTEQLLAEENCFRFLIVSWTAAPASTMQICASQRVLSVSVQERLEAHDGAARLGRGKLGGEPLFGARRHFTGRGR